MLSKLLLNLSSSVPPPQPPSGKDSSHGPLYLALPLPQSCWERKPGPPSHVPGKCSALNQSRPPVHHPHSMPTQCSSAAKPCLGSLFLPRRELAWAHYVRMPSSGKSKKFTTYMLRTLKPSLHMRAKQVLHQ